MSPERWLELRLRCGDRSASELLVEALLDVGGRAAWEEDGWQVSHLPDPGSDAGVAEVLCALRERLAHLLDVESETRWQRQEDWAEYWKRGLEARRLTDRLVVTPTWIEPDLRPGDLVITLDPKMAFGNAEHGTTRGCLRILDHTVVGGEALLDVGAGSAILSIGAVLFGARSVLALEADPLAIPAAAENLDANGVADRVTLREQRVTSEELEALPPFHGVMANLESGFLRPLLAGLVAATAPGGWLLVSGILHHEWDALRAETEAAGVAFAEVDADGEWRSGLFRKL